MLRITTLTIALTALLAAPAAATTFEGNCAGTGWARYENAGLIPKALDWPAEAVAVCTGKIDGAPVNSQPTRIRMLFRDRAASCATIDAVASVRMRFLDRESLRPLKRKKAIAFQTERMVTQLFTGPGVTGYFTAFLNTLEFEDDGLQQCLEGRANHYPFSMRLRTTGGPIG